MRQLRERFVAVAGEAQSAHTEVIRRVRQASNLKGALAEHGKGASHRAGKLAEEASGPEAAAQAAVGKCREARVLHASAAVELARRRHEAARALMGTHDREARHLEERAREAGREAARIEREAGGVAHTRSGRWAHDNGATVRRPWEFER